MKRIAVLALVLLILTACGISNNTESNENKANDPVNEIEENENNKEEVVDKEENDEKKKETETNQDTEDTEKEKESNAPLKTDKPKEDTPKTEVEKKDKQEKLENEEKKDEKQPVEKENPEQMLIGLAEKIIDAQYKQDTDYLKSVISKGTKIEGDLFSFENVTYPHKQEFFTKETASDLSFRYTQPNGEKSYIVGFAAVDKVKDYSFVIDFEFILENGKWKMNDMDVNK